ncbi:MAG TPA: lytic murein transglycosylase [Thermohalobaculum sp.]|nr:lytic murein transglycosylase [Thermohalobaculum sp.]
MERSTAWIARAALAVSLLAPAGCADAGNQPGAVPQPHERADGAPAQAGFAAWRQDFRARALAAGISPGVFDDAFAGVAVNPRVLELDRHQPEFVRPIWEYLDRAVSPERIAQGRARAAEHAALLRQIEARHGVDAGVVAAIWGLESAYGENLGSLPVIESLATLAHDGRRRDFAEEQLIAALRIIQSGDVSPGRMVGSWAGAMGHTQFIPTSFEAYAVDHTGDGRRDVWAANPADALASTANYLARFGWEKGAPAVIEVALPAGFDYRLADDSTRRTAAEWEALGVRGKRAALAPADSVTLLLPAGAAGPAFAAYPNFRVIKRYNNATSYALAVALLAAELDPAMRFGLSPALDWPRSDRPLSRGETEELQRRLTALGYPTEGVDGIIGPNTREAIRRFQANAGMTPDGYVSATLLQRVRAAAGG